MPLSRHIEKTLKLSLFQTIHCVDDCEGIFFLTVIICISFIPGYIPLYLSATILNLHKDLIFLVKKNIFLTKLVNFFVLSPHQIQSLKTQNAVGGKKNLKINLT